MSSRASPRVMGTGQAWGTGYNRQVLAHDLAADAQRFGAAKGTFQTDPGGFMVRRLEDSGVHQDVGVDEHRPP